MLSSPSRPSTCSNANVATSHSAVPGVSTHTRSTSASVHRTSAETRNSIAEENEVKLEMERIRKEHEYEKNKRVEAVCARSRELFAEEVM